MSVRGRGRRGANADSRGKKRDLFNLLPDEVVENILSMLPVKVIRSGRCERVCSRWARLMKRVAAEENNRYSDKYNGKHAFDHIKFSCDGEIHGFHQESALGKIHGYGRNDVPRHILDDYAFRGGTFKGPFVFILIPEREWYHARNLDPDISVRDLFARAREMHEEYEREEIDNGDFGFCDPEEFCDEEHARDYFERLETLEEAHAFEYWPEKVVVDSLKGIVHVQSA